MGKTPFSRKQRDPLEARSSPIDISRARSVEDRVELAEDLSESYLYNRDLSPVRLRNRTWGTYNYAALWIGMSHCIPTYMLAAGLIAGGMNWKQAIFTVMLGNIIVLIPMILNSYAGTKYGIPFPVLCRSLPLSQ